MRRATLSAPPGKRLVVLPGGARNPRWRAALDVLIASGTRKEAAEAAGVTVETLARWHRDADFARELEYEIETVTEGAQRRIRAASERAAGVLVSELDADPDAVGKSRRMLAAEGILDRAGVRVRDASEGVVAAAAAGAAAGATAGKSVQDLMAHHAALLERLRAATAAKDGDDDT